MGYTLQDFQGTVVFDKVAKTLTLSGAKLNSMKDIAVITDVTNNTIVYNFAKRATGAGVTTFNTTTQVITLGYLTNVAAFANTDEFVISLFAQIGEDAPTNSKIFTQLNSPQASKPDPEVLVNTTNLTPRGYVTTITLAAGGTGYTNGTQTFTILAGSGTATFTGTVTGGVLGGTLTMAVRGYDYIVGTNIPVSGPAGSGALINITAVNTGITYRPDSTGNLMGGCRDISFHSVITGDVLFEVECTDEDAATPTRWVPMTQSGLVTAGSLAGTSGYVSLLNFTGKLDFENTNIWKYRIKTTALKPTSSVYVTSIRKGF